jgi:nicotinate-nucleotide adenylyltransferase
MKKIGIFGGTFNPIHTGHLLIAQEVLRSLGLNVIIFVPVYIPPHKKDSDLVSAHDRYNMVKIAISNNPNFKVSASEIKRKGLSYSIDTLREFKRKFGRGTNLYFIIGSDMARELKAWKQIDAINKLVKFVIVNRPGYRMKRLPRYAQLIDSPYINISSRRIRRLIKRGDSVRYLVPHKVLEYILKNKIYLEERKSKDD